MNKIGWCDMTFNPVWGCLNHCEYCYARKMAKRFYSDLKDFKPTWLEQQFNKSFPKKPQRIFVGSMSEIYYWKKEWMEKVLDKVRQYPQHTFQFLTKFPDIYLRYDFPKNCWLGMTITKEENINKNWIRLYRATYAFTNNRFLDKNTKFYYSIEPLLDSINPESLKGINWVILGSETGNKKGKVIPKLEWITNIVDYCRNNNIPVYLKDSIIKLYPDLAFEYPNYHKFPGFYDKKEKG